MASTVLPNGIIVPEKFSRDWYADLYHNWQELDNLLGASGPNDGTLTIQKNGATVGTFSANQATDETINISVPTATSELTNDSGYLTSSSNLDASKLTSGTVDIARLPQGALERLVKVANEAARYALTTADVQLGDTVQQLDTGIMYVVTDTDHLDSAVGYTEYTAGTAASVPWSGVTGKPAFAAVATSGAYSDLTGTPTIPTVNDATLTIQQNGTTVDSFSANSGVDKTINITTADDTKIPLAGSNQISGNLIPNTGNTIDIGSSSKKIKSVFANYLNSIDLRTLYAISNAGHMADLNNSTLRVNGKIIVCSYTANTLNNPTPEASGICFTLANQDSSDYGVQVAFSNKGIYARFISNAQYSAWGTIIHG